MIDRLAPFDAWLSASEDEHLEFKEAKSRFDFGAVLRPRGGRGMMAGSHSIPIRFQWVPMRDAEIQQKKVFGFGTGLEPRFQMPRNQDG